MSEYEAREIIIQVMRSIHYCHNHNICHRDIKLENFMFATKAEDSALKMIDFGLGKRYREEDESSTKESNEGSPISRRRKKVIMRTVLGTIYYASPEVLAGNYNEKCDIWSAGVMLYTMLAGTYPFMGANDHATAQLIQNCSYSIDGAKWRYVTDAAKDLIRRMIVRQEERLDSKGVLSHPWMKMVEEVDNRVQLDFSQIKAFGRMSRFKKAFLTVIATQLDENDSHDFIKQFNRIDADGDGEIGIQEFKDAISKIQNISSSEIEKVFGQVDSDNSGRINYTEFIAATMNQNIYLREEKLYQAFKMFDKNNDGVITPDEIKAVLGSDPKYKDQDTKMWERIIEDADTNKDGHIDYDEFIKLMGKI